MFAFDTGRVSPRRARYFSLLVQRIVPKRKDSRRQGRFAVPCAARTARGLAKLASLGQRQPLSERRSAAQPCLNGGEFKHPSIPAARALGLFLAVMRSRVAQRRADQGRRCLGYWGQTPISLRHFVPHPTGEPKARRIWALTPKTHPARIEQRSVPAQPGDESGSPSLCLLSLGEARESESPVGARPDLHAN